MSQATIERILAEIDQLPEDDRRALERLIAQRREEEWQQLTAEAAAEADRRGITEDTIQQTIERMRYGP